MSRSPLIRNGVSRLFPLRLFRHPTVPLQSHDVNLVSFYRIAAHGTYKKNDKDFLVTVDASKAIQPEGYPFTVDQVIDAVVTCVKIMYPHRPSDEKGVLEIVISRAGDKPKATK